MSGNSITGISFALSHGGSLLDRVSARFQSTSLSDVQSEVDRLVGDAVAAASDGKMIASLFGAELAGRFIRSGAGVAFGKSLFPWAVRGISHATSLAGESAVLTSLERGFAHMQGHPVAQPFQKAWAAAAISLGSIKFLGRAALGQNLITQHLLIDLGMVAGHQGGYALGVTDQPHGSLAQQMIQAESMNLSMKGSLALLHVLSPRLSVLDRLPDFDGLDRAISAQKGSRKFSFGREAGLATAGGPAPASRFDRLGGNPAENRARDLLQAQSVFMTGRGKEGEGIFERKRQARAFKEEGRRLWGEVSDDLIEVFASTSLYTRRVFMRGTQRFLDGKESAETKNLPAEIISSAARLEADFRDHPFNYRRQIETDLQRLRETLQRVPDLWGKMERADFGTVDSKKNEFFSPEDLVLFGRLRRAGALREFLSEVSIPGRFLKSLAERILSHQGLEDMVAEALPGRYPSKDYDFMSVGNAIGAGLGAKEAFREKSKTGAVVEYAGRARGLSPISPRRYDQRTFQDLVQEYSGPSMTRRWLVADDMKIWNSIFVPAIVVARGGNYSKAAEILSYYKNQLKRLSPPAERITPATAWWISRAISGKGEPLSWSFEFFVQPPNPGWTAQERAVVEYWSRSKETLGPRFAREFAGMEQEQAALAYALVGFIRHPYDPKAAMRMALRAPEKIREDALNLTGALLGGFHGAGIFSPRRLADWKTPSIELPSTTSPHFRR